MTLLILAVFAAAALFFIAVLALLDQHEDHKRLARLDVPPGHRDT